MYQHSRSQKVDKWLVVHYKKWLKVRGLSDKGLRPELQAKVKAFLAMPIEDQPKVLPKNYGDPDRVLELLRTMVVMLTTILQPSIEGESHGRILALRIRMFLNAVEDFELPMRKSKPNPTAGGKDDAAPEEEEDAVPPPEDVSPPEEDVVPVPRWQIWSAWKR